MGDSDAVSHGGNEEDDDDEYEESDGGNRLLGFMFGNVDNAGDLDVDYLDEDAKEHFAALASKLGPSLADIDLTKSPSTSAGACEHDYDEKAEDAIDYEDIEEQYEGPEVQAATEEDHLLSKEEYLSSNVSLDLLNQETTIFDEENYDEDEDVGQETELENKDNTGNIDFPPVGNQIEVSHLKVETPDEDALSAESSEPERIMSSGEDYQEEQDTVQQYTNTESGPSLPILCVEDGMVILRFSEIFGIHEPLNKRERRDTHQLSVANVCPKSMDLTYSIEEDEMTYMKSCHYDPLITTSFSLLHDNQTKLDESDAETRSSVFYSQRKDTCFSAEPMKEGIMVDTSTDWMCPFSPKFYPIEQQHWENDIVWGNSPCQGSEPTESFISESDRRCFVDVEADGSNLQRTGQIVEIESNEESAGHFSTEAFDSKNAIQSTILLSSEKRHHPQMLRLGPNLQNDGFDDGEVQQKSGNKNFTEGGLIQRYSKISLQNKNLIEGSWLDHIIWDPINSLPKPKLILDLQDDQMLFELLDDNYLEDLQSHSGAMIVSHLPKASFGSSLDHSGSCGASAGRFNISNDKYYSNRKNSQQLKTNAKKRSIYGLKVMHSAPALRLQTMKPKLSRKELTNFHRPKALWYPHENKVSVKLHGEPRNHGQLKIILKTLSGKLTLLRVDVEETVSSILVKASKKLDFTLQEKIKMFYMGKELENDKSLAMQSVCPNSIICLLRTQITCWPTPQKFPDEDKPVNPTRAFKKKSDLSVKNGHVFLVEYCEERPLLLGNVGMGARLCTYYQKLTPSDQTASTLPNGSMGPGNIIALEQTDKSPFLGDIGAGCSQSSFETNMYRAPIFPHELPKTDYLLVRSAKGMLSLRRIDKIYAAGQQEPHMDVMSPVAKSAQNYLLNRLMVYVHREFHAKEKPASVPFIQTNEISSQFSNLGETLLRKRLKTCADLKRDSKGHLFWVMRRNFRIFNEEELRKLVTPENVCSYESMQAGLHHLISLGIRNLTHPVGLSAAMSRLPDEAIALAAASHIERELQITPWNLSSNFVACTHQNRENIERLEITGVGDPSGRGLGFSYVRVAPKTSGTSSAKKKAPSTRGGSTVTGTDADLRRLSMDAAREVLLKFNVPEENIAKMTRWHRIAMIRKLSSEQAESGIKVDTATLNKFARGQRMSFVQLQQQAREKCQEIWDRQVQFLSAANDDDIGSDSEANSDLDSFAGDLENLLDAEEFEEVGEGNVECKNDKSDGVRGLKMRRCPPQAQTEEEIEEDEEEADAIRRLLDGDESDMKRKKVERASKNEPRLSSGGAELIKRPKVPSGQTINLPKLDASFSFKETMQQTMKEKKSLDKPVRENFVCGACGLVGHMRTNKNCPKFGEELDASEQENMQSKSHPSDHHPLKTPNKKLVSKNMAKATMEGPESSEKSGGKNTSRIQSIKLKCGPPNNTEKNTQGAQSSAQVTKPAADAETECKSTSRINRIIISSKAKSESIHNELQKPSVVIRLPVESDRDRLHKKVIFKQPKCSTTERDSQCVDAGVDKDFRKTKKIAELAGFIEDKLHNQWVTEEMLKKEDTKNQRICEDKRSSKLRILEENARRTLEEEMRMQEEQQRLYEIRMYEEARRREIEEQAKVKKKKKKNKHDFRDEYMHEYSLSRKDWRKSETSSSVKRQPMSGLGRHTAERGLPKKRRRGGEVILSNILESIVDGLRENTNVSYLFLKPVTKKEAPDYFDIIKQPMDLSTIKEKVRRMEYKNRDDFRHDVWQITYNAHMYNDGRNPGIPPLADQLLEICDYLLDVNQDALADAEAGIMQ